MGKHIKKTTDLSGERILLSSPEPTLFQYNDYQYKITPLNMQQRIKWGAISKDRAIKEDEYFKSHGHSNIYHEQKELLNLTWDDKIPTKEEIAKQYIEAVMALEGDNKEEYEKLSTIISKGQEYSYSSVDLSAIISILEQVVEVVDRDGYSGKINHSYIDYWVSKDELKSLCSWVDEVSTLTDNEVLGLEF